jgi:sec-independent protein translocase protein TatB
VFDLSLTKLLVLAVIALIVFGPNELPRIAKQAGSVLRDLRRIAEGAKADLREGLGPEFQDFEFEDLNPRRFVQKHLMDDVNGATQPLFDEFKADSAANGVAVAVGGTAAEAAAAGAVGTAVDPGHGWTTLPEGTDPPFDIDAT